MTRGSPAEASGQIHLFDRLLAINGHKPGTPGAHVPEHATSVELTILPAELPPSHDSVVEVLRVTLERDSHEGFGLGIGFDGEAVVLSSISEGSPAERCRQLFIGNRVVTINGQPVTPTSDFSVLLPRDATRVTLEVTREVSEEYDGPEVGEEQAAEAEEAEEAAKAGRPLYGSPQRRQLEALRHEIDTSVEVVEDEGPTDEEDEEEDGEEEEEEEEGRTRCMKKSLM